MLKLKVATRFKKDLKRYRHNQDVADELDFVMKKLLAEESLPASYCDHHLEGAYRGMRECHLRPDTLLVYTVDSEFLSLKRIGSHSELF